MLAWRCWGHVAIAVALAAVGGRAAAQREGGGTAPAVPAASQASAPQSTLPTPTQRPSALQFVIGEAGLVRVPGGITTLTISGLANLDQMPAANLAKLGQSLAIVDRGVARGPASVASVTLLEPEFVGRWGTNGLAWRIPFKADVPAGTSHVRVAMVTVGTPQPQSYAVEFTVSGKPTSAAQWTARGATDVWTVSWTDKPSVRVFAVTVENPDEPISNLRLAQSSMKDASGHALGVERMHLVTTPDGTGSDSFGVPGNGTRTFFIRLEDGAPGEPHGTFDGVLRLAADGSPILKDVPLKIQASSTYRRLVGVGSIFIGLLFTIFVSAYARSRMARLQALRAAAALRERVMGFQAELAKALPTGMAMPTMQRVAGALAESLGEAGLDEAKLLPSSLALAPGFDAAPDTAPELKAKLEEASKKLEGLLVLLRAGVPRVVPLLQDSAKHDAAVPLAEDLDGFAEKVTGPEDARSKADEVRGKALALAGKELSPHGGGSVVTLSEVDYEIRGLSLVVWAIWALVALVIGAAWIFSDADYGTVTDLVGSFAWGFGMTTFGAGIQNLTPGSVATQLKVKLPT